MKEILKTVIKDWQRTFPRAEVWERNLRVPRDSQKIISLIGPRRCGKTYYLYQLINQLLANDPNAKFIYLNFEDERLTLTSAQLHLTSEAYYELDPENYGQKLYLFF
jgi:predicted AAA+ superfamily ATPase